MNILLLPYRRCRVVYTRERMRLASGILRIGLSAVLLLCVSLPLIAGETEINFAREIQPILTRHCWTCHGPDEDAREAALRLDLRESALGELDSGAFAVVPGNPAKSELWTRITSSDADVRMPPGQGHELSADQQDLLRRWIEQGAPYSAHWAFNSPQRPVTPEVRDQHWPRNDVDRFILRRLEQEGVRPSPEADRVTLIRRLSFDLVGLPPSQREVKEFEHDRRPDAYERLVDRLLASPHFGERWGRHWLDLSRFADSDGYTLNKFRADAWRYRDWVIDAINRDVPFDQFTIEQIAGDLLENPTVEQRVATGFQRNSMKNSGGGLDLEMDRVVRAVDRVSTVGTAWLGLTVGCAECHSHKFDPISHREFYQFYAFFNNVEDHEIEWTRDESPEARQQREEINEKTQQIAAKLRESAGSVDAVAYVDEMLLELAKPVAKRTADGKQALEDWLSALSPSLHESALKYEQLVRAKLPLAVAIASVVREATTRRDTHVHLRGDYQRHGEQVQPDTPGVLPPLEPRGSAADRLDLARWLVDPQHPLTSRVAVNHIWKHLFGQGLVSTPDNFGVSGAPPSHPDLLDWLSAEFVERGWSRKDLIRLIVNSSAYRQVSYARPDLVDRDPLNELLSRQARFRLEAEIVRDVALSASGLLNSRFGGPSVAPSRQALAKYGKGAIVSDTNDYYRRGVYLVYRRGTPLPLLDLFDTPNSTASCAQRQRSNSPLQALMLLNDPVFLECAQHLGAELARMGDVDRDEWITAAFWSCLSREPEAIELKILESFYQEQRALLEEVPAKTVKELVHHAVKEIDPREHALRVIVTRSLMNLDEFITRE